MPCACPYCRPDGWCGCCYSGRKGRGAFPGHWGFRRPKRQRRTSCMALFRRPVPAPGTATAPRPLDPCALSKQFPSVAEFLSLATWPDGTPRVTGTITLLFDEGTPKAALNDRDTGSSCFVSGKTLTELLKRVEGGLTDGSLDWRVKKDQPPAGGRKRS